MICEAIIHQPKRIATPLGTLGELLYAINPKSIDYILNSAYKLFPDSQAAKGEKARPATAKPRPRTRQASNEQVAFALPDEGRSTGRTPAPRPAAAEALGLGLRGPAALAVGARGRRRRGSASGSGSAARCAEPVPLEAVELRPPRLQAPSSLGGLFSDDRHERLCHALGKAYRDVVRGFRGEFANPPDLVACPRDESEVEAVLAWCEEEGAAAIPYGGGTSVVGGVEPRLGDRPGGLDRPAAARPGARGRRRPRAPPGSRPGPPGPALEDQLREHGLTLRHFPQSFEYSTLGGWIATRAGGHFATLYTHIDDLVESVRAITPRGDLGEPPAARLRRRALAGPGADRLRGDPRRDHRGLGAGAAAPRAQALLRGRVRRLPRRRRGGARDLAVRASPRQLPPARRARGRDDRRRQRRARRCSCSASSRPHHPVDHRMDLALEIAREHGGEPGEVRGKARRAARTRSAPGAAPSSARPTCATPSSPAACSATPSRPRSPGTASRTSTRRRWRRRERKVAEVCGRARRWRGRAAGQLPLHPRLPRRPGALLHGPRPGGARRRGRAVGRDQGGGLGGGDRGRRDDHPPPRGRPRPPPLVRPPAPGPLRRGAAGARRRSSTRPAILNPGVLIDP